MEALGLLFVATTPLLLPAQVADSFDAGPRITWSPEILPELRAPRATARTRPALVAVE
jgi:hypothetical protein